MKIGKILDFDDQRYECVGLQPFQSRAGNSSTLIELASRCADCGEVFNFSTTEGAILKRKLNRRCALHKRPGMRVKRVGVFVFDYAFSVSTPIEFVPAAQRVI